MKAEYDLSAGKRGAVLPSKQKPAHLGSAEVIIYKGLCIVMQEAGALYTGSVVGATISIESANRDELEMKIYAAIDKLIQDQPPPNRHIPEFYGGKITLSVSPQLHESIKKTANAQGLSMNTWITQLINKSL